MQLLLKLKNYQTSRFSSDNFFKPLLSFNSEQKEMSYLTNINASLTDKLSKVGVQLVHRLREPDPIGMAKIKQLQSHLLLAKLI